MKYLKQAAVAVIALAGVVTVAPSAQASTAAESNSSGILSGCSTRIAGNDGIGSCYNTTGVRKTMIFHVECNNWFDGNIDKELEVPPYATVETTGHCWSSVDWVTAKLL
ncbi:hypothetical protein [Kribbella sp. NPDC023855]|uniref:hypothetical protein n=1 Tax=Kribbella sp. NPDC023855 TaxID=3154698 RepID=UPI0033E1BCE8